MSNILHNLKLSGQRLMLSVSAEDGAGRIRRLRILAVLFLFAVIWTAQYLLSSHAHAAKPPALPYHGPRNATIEEGQHGFMLLSEAHQFCGRRRWQPYSTRDSRRKVYDMFLLNGELDFLEIRLNELRDEVDWFIILEARTTFQRQPKALHQEEVMSRFKGFEDKIIYQILDETNAQRLPKDDSWEFERFTRNALFDQVLLSLTGAQAPGQGDVLLVGDVDEIPRPGIVTALRNCAFPARVTLRTQMYYYSYQWLHRGELWPHPQATYYNGPRDTVRPENLRSDLADTELFMAGWHCSSCFATMTDLKNKITSFSHKGYNQPYFLDEQRLLSKIRHGEDLFEREGQFYDRIDQNPDIPDFFKSEDSRVKYLYMLDRDASNGNFRDM